MNLVRSRLSICNFLGQRCRQASEAWSHRAMCNKPQEVKAEASPAAPATAPSHKFTLPGLKPTKWDKRFLVWTGRFKTEDQIPETVSIAMLDVAKNKMRIKVSCMMMVATVGGCFLMIYLGKKEAAEHKSLTSMNLAKKAKLKEEFEREKAAAAAALSEKAQ